MADIRPVAGFRTLARGMDGGKAASLIRPDQLALAINLTFRGAYMKTRPPYANHVYTFDSDTTETNWTGKVQGWAYYDGEAGQSGWVIARGGRLFFLTSDTWVLREITPFVMVSTISNFTVPAVAAMVDVHVNATGGIPNGSTVFIGTGIYVTNSPTSNPVPFRFDGLDTPGDVIPAGTQIFDINGNPIKAEQTFPASKDFIFMFQAENYMIILGGQHKTVIFNGTTARQAGIGEIPVGEIGAYGWGRIWISRPGGRSYEGGDLVNSKTLSRSDILGWTENDFLNEGGSFAVPYNAGPITSMTFLADLDTSLGNGPLIIGTPYMAFTNRAPVDRDIWKNLRNPIQTIALLEYGPEGGRCFIHIDSDIWYRSLDGVRSFVIARRDFGSPGNVPLSREIYPILQYDDGSMLRFSAGVYFDNRFLCTVAPLRTELGVEHRGLVAVNFDTVSEMGQKAPPIWEGLWTGLNIFALSKARINGVEKAFAMVHGCNDVEFWEIKRDGISDEYSQEIEDQGVATELELEADPNPSFTDEEVTFTATVAPESGSGATPTGSVQFYIDGSLEETVALVSGVAQFMHNFAGGNYSVRALYTGDIIYGESEDTVAQEVFFTDVTTDLETQVADTSSAVAVTVSFKDGDNVAISGQPFTFVISSVGNVTAPASLPNSNGSGLSTLNWTTGLSKEKTFTVTAGAPYSRVIPTVPSVLWTPQDPNNAVCIILALPTSLAADDVATTTISVILLDGNFNPCLNRTSTLSSTGTGNTITPTALTAGDETSLATLTEPGGFVMPATGVSTASLLVSDSTSLVVDEVINIRHDTFAKNAFMRVMSKADSTHVVLRTLGTFGGGSYGNLQAIPQGSTITKAGIDDALMRSSVAEAKTVTATITAPVAAGTTVSTGVTFT